MVCVTRGWAGRDEADLTENVRAQNQLLLAGRSGEGAVRCDRRPPQRMSAVGPPLSGHALLARFCPEVEFYSGGDTILSLLQAMTMAM
jgi:hypothetical protein